MYVLFCRYGPFHFVNLFVLGIMDENVADIAPFDSIS